MVFIDSSSSCYSATSWDMSAIRGPPFGLSSANILDRRQAKEDRRGLAA
jgi:hypothetical protein